MNAVLSKLDREAGGDPSAVVRAAELVRRTFGISAAEFRLATERSGSIGKMAALAYIRSSTGASFDELIRDGVLDGLATYLEDAGLSGEKMSKAIESLTRRVREDRNTLIFERLRASRRVEAIPDVGSGFGLVQETLDFRNLDSAAPVKIHDVPGVRSKGVNQ